MKTKKLTERWAKDNKPFSVVKKGSGKGKSLGELMKEKNTTEKPDKKLI